MPTKYPIILAHGIAAKQLRVLNAFGNIGRELEAVGNKVYIADTDGFGAIETNAEQLRCFVDRVLKETGAEKVNIIAHSKGGLDSKYMITHLGMEDKVASLTTLCTVSPCPPVQSTDSDNSSNGICILPAFSRK